MTTHAPSHYEIASQLPDNTVVTFHNASWDEYEDLLSQVGETSRLRISFDNGRLQVMTISGEHEKYARFLEKLVAAISLRLRISILSFGSTTMRIQDAAKGNEPDACFYIQRAAALGTRMNLDFTKDPPPDIAVEIDVHHDSENKLAIYAALRVPEVWRWSVGKLIIYVLENDDYVVADASPALPQISSRVLTEFLNRLREHGEFQTLVAFDEWLQECSK